MLINIYVAFWSSGIGCARFWKYYIFYWCSVCMGYHNMWAKVREQLVGEQWVLPFHDLHPRNQTQIPAGAVSISAILLSFGFLLNCSLPSYSFLSENECLVYTCTVCPTNNFCSGCIAKVEFDWGRIISWLFLISDLDDI